MFNIGDRVRHIAWGEGTVLEIYTNREKLRISLDKSPHGFDGSYALVWMRNVEKINTKPFIGDISFEI